MHTAVLVGQEWRMYGKHRLYGTLIDPEITTFDLGHVDVKTGQLHPSMDGEVAKDRATAERYLELIWERWPRRKD